MFECYRKAAADLLNRLFRGGISERIADRVANFTGLWAAMLLVIGLAIWISLPADSSVLPADSVSRIRSHSYHLFFLLAFLSGLGCWWVVLVNERRVAAERSLASAEEIAESANQAKGEFLANMSHEIRTPMNAVIGLSYLALKSEMRPKARDYITKAHHAATSLLAILNDILDFSTLESGNIEIESIDFNLEYLLANISNIASFKVSERNLEFLLDTPRDLPVYMTGDPVGLGKVLTNLIDNAIKFGEAGDIRLVVELLGREAGKLLIKFSVQDSGIGMRQDQIGRLFQPFSQGDGTNARRYGGTGLGLTISKRLVERMGGQIEVESAPGRGSTFSFALWLGESLTEAAPRPPLPAALNGAKVLVVDDNDAARDALRLLLTDITPEIKTAASGSEAIRAIKDAAALGKPFQVVFMDWKMPDMGGAEAAKAIKGDPSYGASPAIVLVTAFGRMAELESGVDAFVSKPVRHSALVEALSDALAPSGTLSGSHAPAIVTASLQGVRVLLGEDDPINQQIATELLGEAGVRVDVAVNGAEVVDLLQKQEVTPYHAVLMDLQMPEMDGYQAARRIRGEPRFAKLPIIAMTAHAMGEVHQACLDAGMNDHIVKPIDPANLYAVVAQWCRHAIRPAEELRAPLDESMNAPDSAARPAEAQSIDVVDFKAGQARVGGRPETYRRILKKFRDSQADSPEQIQRSLEDGDLPTAERLAHTIKGVAGSIGAQSLFERAAELESALRRQIPHAEAFQAFRDELGRVLLAVEVFLGDVSGVESPKPSASRPAVIAPELISNLVTLLRELDSEAVDFLSQNAPAFRAAMGEENFQELDKTINNFDFKAAAARLAPYVADSLHA